MTNKELEKRIIELEDRLEEFLCSQKTKRQHEFKVGDRVQFKSWKEMEKEFGLNDDGNICISPCFAHHMKHLCGTYATILRIVGRSVTLKDFSASGRTDWCYIVDMLKPATDKPKFKVGDRVKQLFRNPTHNRIGTIESYEGHCVYYIRFDDGDLARYHQDCVEPYTEPRWTFTEEEKVILRNVSKDYKWLIRDKDGELCIYEEIPHKLENMWDSDSGSVMGICGFNHLFQSIKWEDDEACEFRKFI